MNDDVRDYYFGLPPEDRKNLIRTIAGWLSDIGLFSQLVVERRLRSYQVEPARAILDSILHGRGRTFVVTMSRQAGKNELSGQLEAYLLNLFWRKGGQIVKAYVVLSSACVDSSWR